MTDTMGRMHFRCAVRRLLLRARARGDDGLPGHGQQPDGRRHRRRGRRCCGEPEVRKAFQNAAKSNLFAKNKVPASTRKRVLLRFCQHFANLCSKSALK